MNLDDIVPEEDEARAERIQQRMFRVIRMRNKILDSWWFRWGPGIWFEIFLGQSVFSHPKIKQAHRLTDRLGMQQYNLTRQPIVDALIRDAEETLRKGKEILEGKNNDLV